MHHNSVMGTNIIGFILNSNNYGFRCWMIDMYYIINGEYWWILYTCKAETSNMNVCNIQHTSWQMERVLTGAPAIILQIPEAAVTTMIKTPAVGPMVAVATVATEIETWAPVAIRLAPMEVSDSGTNMGASMDVTRAQKSSRWAIVIMVLHCYPHIKGLTY